MLTLRKVELIGFKSFCDRTEISFERDGITAIVGPNGCGKSNIADAINWVLGEQSAKSLRGERMADVIFNGTAKRPPLGLAEVSLTLVDPEFEKEAPLDASEVAARPVEGAEEIPVEAFPNGDGGIMENGAARSVEPAPPARLQTGGRSGEIVVSRRLFRSGESEYLLNGKICRLRDIQEIFMGTGLGPDTYAIIEQGRIGQILSSKPHDRRAIIEEAAGVTKYKNRRRLAEAKLESAKLNLARVNDILVEVEKQLNSLKRQATKARRYRELREQMREQFRILMANKARDLAAQLALVAQALQERQAALFTQESSLATLEVEQAGLNQRNFELESELRSNQNAVNQQALELDRAQNRIQFSVEQIDRIENEVRAAELEAIGLTERLAAARRKQEEKRLAAETIGAEYNEKTNQFENLNRRHQDHLSSQQAGETELEGRNRNLLATIEEQASLSTQRTQLDERGSTSREEMARLVALGVDLQEERDASKRQLGQATRAGAELQERCSRLAVEIGQAQTELAGAKGRKETTTAEVEGLRERLASVRAKLHSISQILEQRAYSAGAVQKLFAAKNDPGNRRFRPVGVLADFADVEAEYEAAVQEFLREELEYVVVETFDEAREGVELLRGPVGGHATFFVDSLGKLAAAKHYSHSQVSDQSIIVPLAQLVRFHQPLGEMAKQFLPRLLAAYLVEESGDAERLAHEHPGQYFLTADGVCYYGRLVSGGKATEAGPLALKREQCSAERELGSLESSLASRLSDMERSNAEIADMEAELLQRHAEKQETEKSQVAAEHLRAQAESELGRAEKELHAHSEHAARLEQEIACLESRRRTTEEAMAAAADRRRQLQGAIESQIEQSRSLRQTLAEISDDRAGLRSELAALEERKSSAEAEHDRWQQDVVELSQQANTLAADQSRLRQEEFELRAAIGGLKDQMHDDAEAKVRLEETKTRLESEWEQLKGRTIHLDDEIRQARRRLDALRDERGQKELERVRLESERSHLEETCRNELGLAPADIFLNEEQTLNAEALALADQTYREMREKLEGMGPVNMMALEEYQETDQRHRFLSGQRDDLVASIADTMQAIAEIDDVSHKQFVEAFEAINRFFNETFRTLFGGGSGAMRLTDEMNLAESGLDIVAQPPGKKLQNVLLLSGGEKALTALALLLAIFRFQPSPFCILDEVDAPLDEANVGRFTAMIQEMARHNQFILITHNKKTMEMAPVLYGVTMQEPGVSKLVSVNFGEEAEATAA